MKDANIQELSEGGLTPFLPLLAEIECGDHFDSGNPDHTTWLERKIKSHLARGSRFFGYRSKEGGILGIVGILIEPRLFCTPTAEILDIGVVNGHRRDGLGTELLNQALTIAREAGAHAVFARTYAADFGTIAFYGRSQFHPVAVIPDTNGPTDEGDIVMRRRLSESLDPDAAASQP